MDNIQRNFWKRLIYPTGLKRFLFFFLCDILIISFSLFLSFLLRFEFSLPGQYLKMIQIALPLFIVVKLTNFAIFDMYRISWRYISVKDFINIVLAVITSQAILASFILIFSEMPSYAATIVPHYLESALVSLKGFPRSIYIIDVIISMILLSGQRLSKRIFLEVIHKKRNTNTGKRTLIIGAGNTGEMILRDIDKQDGPEFYPVGLLDDDRQKIGTFIHGVQVLDSTGALKDIIKKYNITAMIIAIPSLNFKLLRDLYGKAQEAKLETIKIVPRIYDFHRPDIGIKKLEDISIEDILGRQVVNVDYAEIGNFLKDKIVLVTGAGGSIGSEIIMQVCSFKPKKVLVFDIDETELHNLRIKIDGAFPFLKEHVHFLVGDVKDQDRIRECFESFHPQIVFHAAAYKHVPIMEDNPDEAVKVNMFGTYTIAKASVQHGVERFIMISTDKAVQPTSIMGATKRFAEHICKAFNNAGQTSFISVRFGNVLGSRGSVLPLFLDQLKQGGPLTVTHKDMKRYFMTIPEAVSLVLQAAVIGKSGEVLVLDMGDPVYIVRLAEEVIRIHGLEPYKDIPIEFTGIRPGEKLFEEVLTAEEGTFKTEHEKVFIAKCSEKFSLDEIETILKEFSDTIKEKMRGQDGMIKSLLKKYVRHYETINDR
jgi:FlaA1/EpsC-like NDP-sugar epimerase